VPYRVIASSPLMFARTPPYRAFSPKWLCPYLYVAHMYVRCVCVCACVFIPTWVNGGVSPPARHHRRVVPLLGAFFPLFYFVFYFFFPHTRHVLPAITVLHSHLRSTLTTTTVRTTVELELTIWFNDLIIAYVLSIIRIFFFYLVRRSDNMSRN
jgi:hypothetical protein